jgi:hypothetical protein
LKVTSRQTMKKIILSIIFSSTLGTEGRLFAQSTTILPSSLQLPNVQSLGSCTTTQKGQLVLLTTDNKTYYCNGTTWESLLTVSSNNPWLVNGTHINNGNSGNVGIGIASPTQKLDVVGSIKLSGEINRPSTGTSNLIPIAYGTIQDNGTILSDTGNFTFTDLGTGIKKITVTGVNLNISNHTIVGSTHATTPRFSNFVIISGELQVFIHNQNGTPVNSPFSFVIYSN